MFVGAKQAARAAKSGRHSRTAAARKPGSAKHAAAKHTKHAKHGGKGASKHAQLKPAKKKIREASLKKR